MLKQQFYLKTLTTFLVFSIVIGYFIFISTTYLRENVEDFSSIESNRLRRDAADTANDGGSIHTNKNPRKYIEKYQKTLDVHKVRRKRFTAGKRSTTCKTKKVEPDDNYWHELKSNLSNLTEEDIMKNNYLKKLKLSKNQLRALEKRTKRQYECHEWHVERKKRLTASSFGRICRMRGNTARKKYVDYLLYGTFVGNAATRHGLHFEDTARKSLEKALGKKIRSSGLMIDYTLPFLAATPDGLVATNAIVEIKCPHVAKNMTPEEGITSHAIKYCRIKDGQLHLKVNSYYYYQVQGQLHVSNKLFCYFCVWTPKGMLYEKIYRDDYFWEKFMETQLKTFYFDDMLPELILQNDDTLYY